MIFKRKRIIPKGVKQESINGGFTFVETLAVIAVTAVLASQISVGAFKLLQKGKVAAVKSQIESYRASLQSYYIDCGHFPTEVQGLNSLWEKPSEEEKWDGPYTEKQIGKDPWGNDYVYLKESIVWGGSEGDFQDLPEGLPFGIVSYGADGKTGGIGNEKDICSWQ